MALNIISGNMYSFVTHTWNTIKGECPHGCTYCYMKRFGKQKPVRFVPGELKDDLGKGNFIFVGSSCDMWAKGIDTDWIISTLDHLKKFKNKYLFQTKNPKKLFELRMLLPERSFVGTTIETNRVYSEMGNSPDPLVRADYLGMLWNTKTTMVTIEPIMDFDLEELIKLIRICSPSWVNIGADSQGHKLPEPPRWKLKELIGRLEKFTEVKIKKNLNRLLKRGEG